jgi:amino acid adenylation domain-containing protein
LPRPGGGPAPLSFAQQRLWFLDRLEPGSSLYNVFRAFELTGPLDLEALRAALAEVVRRHEVLRSTFLDQGGQPRQVAMAAAPLPLPVIDLSGLAAGAGERAARDAAAGEADRPFDLEHGPLLRARLLRLGPHRHQLLLTLHHIACDARSLEVLLRELSLLYAAGGAPSALPEPRLQFADFAHWEASRGEALDAHLPYWRDRLAGLTELRLPFDRARPAVQSHRGARWVGPLAVDFRRVGQLAQQLRTTRFSLLLAAFAAFLAWITGQDDLAIGSPFAGRTWPGTEDVVGFFVQSLVLRLDASGDPGFAGLLRRVFVTLAEAQGHQDLPFDRLVQVLHPERSLSHNPLFQVLFAVQAAAANSLTLAGIEVARIPLATSTAKLDLTFELLEEAGGERALLSIEHSTELFSRATVQRLAGSFSRLLEACLQEPDRPLSTLSLLSPAERHQLLVEWNEGRDGDLAPDRSAADRSAGGACLHDLFLQQAERTPEAAALVTPGERITYGELARRAQRLAHRLRALGVGPEVRVGVFAERTAEMLAALLGTLVAGGAYVPLDPEYPQERLAFLLQDSAAPIVLVQAALLDRLPAHAAQVVCLESALAEGGAEGGLASNTEPGNLAYLIYTSGSTGRPKGVAITHRSAVARLRWARREFSAGELAAVLASTSICFDVSVFELFAPLAWGGRVILCRNVLDLPRLPSRDEVATLCTVPSALAELVSESALPPSLRTLCLAGEPLRRPLVERLLALPGIGRVINLYGPSEDTTYSTISITAPRDAGEPAIGRPLPGSRAYVIDSRLALLPQGAAGELALAGSGLARGYLGRPELTAERFRPDPFASAPGQRLYRTGDLARRGPTGELEFLGRLDHQVKVRGFRIELGEIESALGALPGVREAAALATGLPGELSLVAFYVGDDSASPEPALRARLRQRLPDYMVPARLVRLGSLPRTPNGKLDRQALRAAAAGGVAAATARPPASPLEELIAGVWCDVLGLREVGADRDFFDLGGHSLLAMRVLARLRESCGVDLGVRDLFEQRTVAALAAWIERVRWRPGRPPAPPLVRGVHAGDLPLSFAQERLWFLEELDRGNAAYHLPAALEIRGALSPVALAAALNEIVRRHEVLRTLFVASARGVTQRVVAHAPRRLACIDLAALPAPLARRAAGEVGHAEARAPFDLARGPLLRATLLRLADGEHRLLLTFHHIAADGWALALFFDELALLYGAAAAGTPSPLPELPVQIADYALWQRAWLRDEVLAEELAYWRQALAGVPARLALPTDRPRPAVQAFRGSMLERRLPAALGEDLGGLARARRATLFMALLGGLEITLQRYCRQHDLVVGTPVANRGRVEIEPLIGFFVNTLALRADLAGDPPVAALLGRVRESALGAYAHQDLPFERLVAELQPERDLGRTPIFQILMVLQNARPAEPRLPGLEVTPLAIPTGAAKLDLSLALAADASGLRAQWTYDASLFDGATIARLAAHCEQLWAEMVLAPERRLSALSMLTAAERAQLAAWNDTLATYPEGLTLSRLLAAQIERTPDAVALLHEGEELTYRQLGRRVGALAGELRRRGVGPEVRVGLYFERSPELVVGLLGVVAAGGAYVPLDPSYPWGRVAAMLEDAAPRLLLTVTARRSSLAGVGAPVLCLDALEPPAVADLPPAAWAGSCAEENLAYVIFTSGSTGRPKGVMNSHRGIVNRLLWMQETFPFTAADRVLQKTPASFDVSVWELFAPLLAGSTLVVARSDGHRDPAYLARLIAEAGITVVHFVPSLLRAFLAEPDLKSSCATLRRIFTSGEALPGELAQLCLARLDAELHNLYGPTEAAVEVTWWACERGDPRAGVPIGRPIANTEIHLLDPDLNPVPAGLQAELFIGGVQVARGYLGRPDLTAERFVPDGASGRYGARLYRTGDAARWRTDGAIEFLGRLDHQVKIRGVRIELGEVEAALRGHPRIDDAVVVALPEPGSTLPEPPPAQQLVAYLVAAGTAPSAAEIRDWLLRSLPEAMVPAVFVRLPALPLTASGKIDRRALPAPERAAPAAVSGAPLTATEELLAGIWAEVLGTAPASAGDDFFDLGGHSLLAAQVVARVREIFRCELGLRAIFAATTLQALAARIDAARAARGGAAPADPPLAATEAEADLPLSFAQERLWFLEQLRPGGSLYNMPLALALTGTLDVERLRRAGEQVVDRHQALRAVFASVDGRPVQRLAPRQPLALPLVDLTELPASDALARELAGEEAGRPFALARGPLLRLLLLRIAADRHLLVLHCHHIVADGWSLGVFLRELAVLYAPGETASPAPLPPLPIQYFDFSRWQRRRAAAYDEQLAFWRQSLAGAPQLLELPADRPRPPLPSYRGGKVLALIPPPIVERLRAQSRRQVTTLFMTLLAALSALLARLCGQRDLLIGTPVAERDQLATEGLIGLFVNTLVLRCDLAGDPAFSALQERSREVVLAAYAHHEIPFERLVEELAPARGLGLPPLVQVLLVPQRSPLAGLALPGLEIAPVPLPASAARFDLALSAAVGERALPLALEYAADLVDRSTAARWLAHWEALLAAVAERPELPLSALPLLGEVQRAQLLVEWNDRAGGPLADLRVHDLFARAAARWPERCAVEWEGTTLTYAELDLRVRRLAARLRRRGVGPDIAVGLCAERSPDLVAGMLAILEAGGCYLPLDPDYPQERLAYMLEDAAVPVVLTQERLLPWLPESIQRVALDGQAEDEAAGDLPPSTQPPLPANLAYVIYTSGSTGRPKGTLVAHRGVVNMLRWRQARYPLSPEDRVLQTDSFSFDASVWQFFWPLSSGARLVLTRPGGNRDGGYLVDLLARRDITVVGLVPFMLRVVLEEPRLARCGALRHVFCGGEALHLDLVRRLCGVLPGLELHNVYGPTEATIDATDATYRGDEPGPPGRVAPIGRPLAHQRVYVLDPDGGAVPPGVAGELHIGGAGLARGYHRQPAATAERFLPDPLSGLPGERLYRTGDRVRWLAGGRLEFLGRLDHQVKLRGFRIELQEIEAVLRRQPQVGGVAVVARGEGAEQRLVAFVAPAGEIASAPIPDLAALRALAERELPAHMVPARFVLLPALPLTPNGKVDARALPALPELQPSPAPATVPRGQLERSLVALWRQLLGRDEIGREESFFDLGGHSLLLIRLQERLLQNLGRSVSLVDLFRFPTIAALVEHLDSPAGTTGSAAPALLRAEVDRRPGAIAIVGMAGRFPGAPDVAAFWENLRRGVESISRFTPQELLASGVDPELLRDPGYVPAKGVLAGADLFAADFFGCSPRESELMDPQHRLLLECAWECLEDSGHDPARHPGRIGIFAGASMNTYLLARVAAHRALSAPGYPLAVSNDKDHLPTRVSYRLNLRGPSVLVQSACSTSLVAVHLACRSLVDGECDLALAGGVAVSVPLAGGHLYREGSILSPDGHCRAFDETASGIVGGNGVGLVALRRLDDAVASGDAIRAIIRGSAINNDGHQKAGYMAPSVQGQAEVVREALARAGVDPATIGYIEAHGTGTPLGDPIEVAALDEVFRPCTDRRAFCALASVKTNIGHLDAAAGVTGLIKAVLALEHGEIPPSLHFERPNPRLGLDDSPFFVSRRLSAWPAREEPRRAGVSSFGIGGTNAHVVLEEAPPAASSPSSQSAPAAWPCHLLPLSARSAAALAALTRRLADHLDSHPGLALERVAYTLQAGRAAFAHRRFAVARDARQAAAKLRLEGASLAVPVAGAEPAIAFLFPGQGAQQLDMGRELYALEPRFRADVDRCAETLAPALGRDLRTEIFVPPGIVLDTAELALAQTALTQPALFTIEYALARLWMSWGLRPQALLGHSLGELVAATLAGVWSLDDALALVAERGRLLQATPPGAMLAVELAENELAPLLGEGLALAAVNAPRSCVVSGVRDAAAALAGRLRALGVDHRPLRVSHAFHSALIEPALAPFAAAVGRVALAPPRIPFLSNVTGTWIRDAEATDPAYWARQLRATVRFADAAAELLREPGRLLLEVGPGHSLAALVRRQDAAAAPRLIPSLRRRAAEETSDVEALWEAAGRLWLAGVQLDWDAVHAGRRPRRVPLPTYPFERQRYWLDDGAVTPSPETKSGTESGPELAVELWRESRTPRPAPAGGPANWVLVGPPALTRALARRLGLSGARVTAAFPVGGEAFDRMTAAETDGPLRVIALWGWGTGKGSASVTRRTRQRQPLEALEHLAAGIAARGGGEIILVTRRGCALAEGAPQGADAALGFAAGEELRWLHPGLRWRTLDLAPPPGTRPEVAAGLLARALLVEAGAPVADGVVAWRGPTRWVRRREPVTAAAAAEIRPGSVYLVLGGASPSGLPFLEALAAHPGVRLIATGPLSLPTEMPRRGSPATPPEAAEELASALLRLQALEAAGAEILIGRDDRRRAALRQLVARARALFGALDGVVDLTGLIDAGPPSPPVRIRFLTSLQAALAGTEVGCVQIHDRRGAAASDFVAGVTHRAALETTVRSLGLAGPGAWSSVLWELPAGGTGTSAADTPPTAARALALARVITTAAAGGHLIVGALEPGPGSAGAVAAAHASRSVPAPPQAAFLLPENAAAPTSVPPTSATAGALPPSEPSAPTLPAQPRPMRSVPFVAPADELERAVAAIWQELLGLSEVGACDDFFELGGDSLLATQVAAYLRERLGMQVPLSRVLGQPTVRALAEACRQLAAASEADGELAQLWREVASLSSEELERLLAPEACPGTLATGDQE